MLKKPQKIPKRSKEKNLWFDYESSGFNLQVGERFLAFTFTGFPTHVQISEKRREKKDISGKVTNPRTAGTPNYVKINSQNIYNSKYDKFSQAKVIAFIKEYLTYHIKVGVKELGLICKNLVKTYPVNISAQVYAPYSLGGCKYIGGEFKQVVSHSWDIGNFGWIWCKCFDDVLQDVGIIVNDSVDYVRTTGGVSFIPTEESEFSKRKIVFYIEW